MRAGWDLAFLAEDRPAGRRRRGSWGPEDTKVRVVGDKPLLEWPHVDQVAGEDTH